MQSNHRTQKKHTHIPHTQIVLRTKSVRESFITGRNPHEKFSGKMKLFRSQSVRLLSFLPNENFNCTVNAFYSVGLCKCAPLNLYHIKIGIGLSTQVHSTTKHTYTTHLSWALCNERYSKSCNFKPEQWFSLKGQYFCCCEWL